MQGKTILEEMIERQADAIAGAMLLLEPAAKECGDINAMSAASLAISMKRIADFVCGTLERRDVVEYTLGELDHRK